MKFDFEKSEAMLFLEDGTMLCDDGDIQDLQIMDGKTITIANWFKTTKRKGIILRHIFLFFDSVDAIFFANSGVTIL